MARPTTEKKETSIIVRISEELKQNLMAEAKLKNKKLSAYIRDILKGDDFVIQNTKSGFSIDISDETYASLMGMISFYGGSLENLVVMLDEAMVEGTVMYEDGKIVGVPQIDLENLYEICHEMNIDPQEAIDRLVKEMER